MIDQKIKKTKYYIVAAVSVLIILVIVLISILNRSNIKITVDPVDSVVTIDNAPIKLNNKGFASVKVKPGKADLRIEADGYIGYSQIIDLKPGRSISKEFQLKKNPNPISIGDTQEAGNNVQFISEADEDNSLFYLGDNGSTLFKAKFEIDENNNTKILYNRAISNPPLSGIEKIIWSPNKDAAIFKKDNGIYFFDFKKYNFVSQEEVKYGENIGDVAWSPDDSKIAYYYAPPNGEKSLIFANKTNTEMTRVANFAEMGIDDPYLSWSPNSEWLIVIPRNKDYGSNKIYLFNAYTRTFKTVVDSGSNIEAVFNRAGDKIIYSTYSIDPASPVKQILSIMDINGDNKQSLNIRAFIPKIVFLNNVSYDIIVATYNAESTTESMFLFDYNKKEDAGFKINLDPDVYIKEMSISKDDKMLFYIANDKFYAMSLK